MTRQPKIWTEDEIVRLTQLLNEELTYQEIAGKLGRSVQATRTKILKLRKKLGNKKIRPRHYTDEESEKIKELFAEYVPGDAHRLYNKWAISNGYPKRDYSRLWKKADDMRKKKQMEIDYTGNYLTCSAIGAILGCDRRVAETIVQRHKEALKPQWLDKEGGTLLIKIYDLSRFVKTDEGKSVLKRYWKRLDIDYILFLLTDKIKDIDK